MKLIRKVCSNENDNVSLDLLPCPRNSEGYNLLKYSTFFFFYQDQANMVSHLQIPKSLYNERHIYIYIKKKGTTFKHMIMDRVIVHACFYNFSQMKSHCKKEKLT